MRKVAKIFSVFGNKYFISLTIFAIIMLISDRNNIFEQIDRKHQLKDLQAKKRYYNEEIEKTKRELADLNNNPVALEKYARENFYMKKDNEDLFIVDGFADSLKKTP